MMMIDGRGEAGRQLRLKREWDGVQDERRDAGYGITMRDEICIAYGVLLIYLVKSLSKAGIYYYIYMNERRLG